MRDEIEAALRITPLFYDAAFDSSRWPDVLELLAERFGARVVQLNVGRYDPAAGVAVLLATHIWPPDPASMARYLTFGGHVTDDPRLAAAMRVPNRPVSRRDLVPDDDWYTSRIYRELFEPGGVDDHLGFTILDEGSDFAAALMLARPPDAPVFDPDDVDRLHLYIPHFRRAGRVMLRTVAAEDIAVALVSALDAIDIATFVIDGVGRVALQNAAARALAVSGDVTLVGGKLSAADPVTRAALRQAIDRATCETAGKGGVESVVIHRADGRLGLLATFRRLDGTIALAGDVDATARAIVFIVDPERQSETREEALQRIFGLTAAEADVARRFVDGASVRQIGAETGRSYETVRWHLKQVMGKLGVRRQTELVVALKGASVPLRTG